MQSNLNKYISKNSKHAFSPQAGTSTWHPCGIYEPSQNKSMESDPIDFSPKREFLYSDNMVQACLFVMSLDDELFQPLLALERNDGLPPLLNLGSGSDLTIANLASLIKDVVGFKGDITFDDTKPDGTIRKLMDSSRLNQLGWHVSTPLKEGLLQAYQDFKGTLI